MTSNSGRRGRQLGGGDCDDRTAKQPSTYGDDECNTGSTSNHKKGVLDMSFASSFISRMNNDNVRWDCDLMWRKHRNKREEDERAVAGRNLHRRNDRQLSDEEGMKKRQKTGFIHDANTRKNRVASSDSRKTRSRNRHSSFDRQQSTPTTFRQQKAVSSQNNYRRERDRHRQRQRSRSASSRRGRRNKNSRSREALSDDGDKISSDYHSDDSDDPYTKERLRQREMKSAKYDEIHGKFKQLAGASSVRTTQTRNDYDYMFLDKIKDHINAKSESKNPMKGGKTKKHKSDDKKNEKKRKKKEKRAKKKHRKRSSETSTSSTSSDS